MKNRKNNLFPAGVLMVLVLSVICYCKITGCFHVKSFSGNAETFVERNDSLIEKAKTFDQDKVLSELGRHPVNGFYYRFDDNIDNADFICELGADVEESYLFSMEFDEDSATYIKPKKEEIQVTNGMLRITHKKNGYWETCNEVAIDIEEVGELEIRMKTEKGIVLTLAWARDEAAEFFKRKDTQRLHIDVIPDNEFHTYKLNVKNAMRKTPWGTFTIRKLSMEASNVPGDNTEIDYIRLISKQKKYLEDECGISYELIKGEFRKSIHTVAPGVLKYKLTIPKEECFLSFGTGVLDDNAVNFSVIIKHDSIEKEVFSNQKTNSSKWDNFNISLAEYSNKEVEVIFKTKSDKKNIAFWSNLVIYTAAKKRFNVIIVLEDTLRAHSLSCYGHKRKTTPVKDELIKDGVLFLNAFAQATKTRMSMPSVMTSLYPTSTGVWNFFERLDEHYLTLAEVLRHQGFQTVFFMQNPNAGPVAGLQQGYSRIFHKCPKKAPGIYDKMAPAWLEENRDRNFLMYLHIIDPHWPYDPPEDHRKWYNSLERDDAEYIEPERTDQFDPEWVEKPSVETRRALYDDEVSFNDHYLGIFLNKLKELGIYDDTLIIFMSDHGEHIGEHNEWGHSPPGYVHGIKTPLIAVYPKKLPKNIKINQLVQNLDIMPTILDLLDIDTSGMLMQGNSLIPLINNKNRGYWNNRVIMSDEVVYRKDKEDTRELGSIFFHNTHILSSCKQDGMELDGMKQFDFISDREETNNIAITDEAERQYKLFIKQVQQGNMEIWKALTKDQIMSINYDPETIERLKSLGYMGGAK